MLNNLSQRGCGPRSLQNNYIETQVHEFCLNAGFEPGNLKIITTRPKSDMFPKNLRLVGEEMARNNTTKLRRRSVSGAKKMLCLVVFSFFSLCTDR